MSEALDAVALLRRTDTIRARANALLARARRGESEWFTLGGDEALDAAAQTVAEVTRQRYPLGDIPFHSRWRHFEAGGIDRRAMLDRLLGTDAQERACAHIDLALVSVLLDAGAGPDWSYHEAGNGLRFSRSEGLGVASFHAFTAGLFSSDPARPLQADADGLRALTPEALGAAFQVSADNPLVGLEGRTQLLRRLGDALAAQPEVYGTPGRPGGLFNALSTPAGVAAHDILALLLNTLSGIWPSANTIAGVPVGDCWPHPAVDGPGLTQGWMPFHKLSQWLSYSLLEPFAWAGVPVHGLDALTALPEYRNGGLLIDAGVIVSRDAATLERLWQPGDECIVEWRALTVALLDELAPRVRALLGRSALQMPLACVLEGGTWAAGRVLAQKLRGGTPPLHIASDGTVF
ncbi:MAG: URC4/urg3 family protein [Acidovorax sp.]